MSDRPPCPVCWHEETMRAARQERLEHDLTDETLLLWQRPYGGARGQVVTRWDGGSWQCPTCGVVLIPHDAAVLLDAVLTVSYPAWRDNPTQLAWFTAAAKGGHVLAQERPNDGRSGRCGIRISGDEWCVLDVGHGGKHV